jgi:hypothetical protein
MYQKEINAIQNSLSDELLTSYQKKLLTGIHKTEGHCYVAAEAIYHLLGGRSNGWEAFVLPKIVLTNNTHWWIKNKYTGTIVDPTKEQFGGDPIPYDKGKKCGFLTSSPSKRARVVLERARRLLRA